MKKVTIILIGPLYMYQELLNGLIHSLKIMGYDPETIHHPQPRPDFKSKAKLNIIISGKGFIPNKDNINILIEVDQNLRRRDPEYIKEQYHNYTKILDIFKEQATDFPNGEYFPIGYSDAFSLNSTPDSKYTQDVLHFGQVIPGWRRERLITKFNIHNINLFGHSRDQYITNAKINVTLRKHEDYYFAPIHALLILCKGKLLLQEKCSEYGVYADSIIEFTEDTYLDTVNYWLQNKEARVKFETDARDNLKTHHDMTKYLKEALYGI